MSDIGKPMIKFIDESQSNEPSSIGSLTGLIKNITGACKEIAGLVTRGGINDLNGVAGSENIQGEAQKKLDIISNDVMVRHLSSSGHLAAMLSEEVEGIIRMPSGVPKGDYLVAFDPLDGSSNIDVNISVGTIFSVLRCPSGIKEPTAEDFLQLGTEQVCAGFCVYGPVTMMVVTTGKGVNGFTLDRKLDEFILTHPKMTIPEEAAEFAINMSNQRFWEPPVHRYIDECLLGVDGVREKDFNMRWVASMVAEVYRVLTRGGLFMYPLDSKPKTKGGKLRLMYEASPMSFIIEQAGGLSSTGHERIMTTEPESIHQRVPVILGSKKEVERLVLYHQERD